MIEGQNHMRDKHLHCHHPAVEHGVNEERGCGPGATYVLVLFYLPLMIRVILCGHIGLLELFREVEKN